jgi:hypothetical protein
VDTILKALQPINKVTSLVAYEKTQKFCHSVTAQTFGALAGHLGTAPDEVHGSLMDQTTAVVAYRCNKAADALNADSSDRTVHRHWSRKCPLHDAF